MYAKYKREWTPLEQWKPIDMQLPINTRYMTLTTLIVLWIFQYSSNGCNCPRIVYTWWHYRSLLLNTPCLPCPYRFFALIGYYWYSLSKQLWGPHDIGMSPVKGNPSWATFPIQMGHSSPSQDWILIMQLMYVLVYAMFILVCMVSCTCHVHPCVISCPWRHYSFMPCSCPYSKGWALYYLNNVMFKWNT